MYNDVCFLDIWPKIMSGDALLSLGESITELSCRNELSYNASPTRANSMTLYNDEEAFYVPTVDFTLGYITAETLSKFMQICNSKGFVASYFDYELGEVVHRAMYLSDASLERLYSIGGDIEAAIGLKLKMVSRYGYPYTTASDSNFSIEGNKYHMYQLHAHKGMDTLIPDGEKEADYV